MDFQRRNIASTVPLHREFQQPSGNLWADVIRSEPTPKIKIMHQHFV
jgi:hypothetical protein